MPIPSPFLSQPDLLTLNTKELPIFKDALIPGVDVQPLFLDPYVGVWVLRVIFHPGVILPTHYHTGQVHMFTMSGRWGYVEHQDQMQTAGCYLYEPGNSVHTFMTPADNTEPTDTFMVVFGANVNFVPPGDYHSMLDANHIIQMLKGLEQERGLDPARYITPGAPRYSDEK